jgi:hypothetical protein
MLGKPSKPKMPWAVRVLTPDFLVDGSFNESDKTPWTSFFRAVSNTDTGPQEIMRLTSARMHSSSGRLPVPADVQPNWVVSQSGSIIAVIPHDETSIKYVAEANSRNTALPADLYVGPYLIRGVLLNASQDIGYLDSCFSVVLKDAQIDCLLPGSSIKSLQAPYAIVRTLLMQGIVFRN